MVIIIVVINRLYLGSYTIVSFIPDALNQFAPELYRLEQVITEVKTDLMSFSLPADLCNAHSKRLPQLSPDVM